MDILVVINALIISSENKDKHTKTISRFTLHPFPVLRTLVHKHRKPRHNYGTLQPYDTIRYKWACTIYNTFPLVLYMKPVLNKNKHELLHMLKSSTYHIPYLPIIYSVFPCPHTRWTFYPDIRGFFLILVTLNHKMLLYAYLSYSQFSPRTRSSQNYSHDTSRTFIYTSTFFVSIVTLTKTGEC